MDKRNTPEPKKDSSVSGRIYRNGVITLGGKKADAQAYVHKTPREEQKERPRQGLKGLTKNDKRNVESALFWLKDMFGVERIRWIVITYPDASNEAITNLLRDWDKFKDKLGRILNKNSFKLWVVSIGLQVATSSKKKIPCYDINIAVVDRGEKQSKYLIDSIYGAMSKIARETIRPPLDLHNQTIYNTNENFRELTHYFVKQVDESFLWKLQNEHPSNYFLKTWAMLPLGLKKASKPVRGELKGVDLKETKKLITDSLKGLVKLLPNHSNKQKLVAEFDPLKATPEETWRLFKILTEQ